MRMAIFFLFEDVSPIEETSSSGKKRRKVTRLPLDQFLIARVLDHQVMIRTFQILHADFQLFVDFQPRIVHLPQGGSLLFHVLRNEQITCVFIGQCNFEVERLRKSLRFEFSYYTPRLSLVHNKNAPYARKTRELLIKLSAGNRRATGLPQAIIIVYELVTITREKLWQDL